MIDYRLYAEIADIIVECLFAVSFAVTYCVVRRIQMKRAK
jgi:hypothetical protein